jgi:N-acylneuraminate cytidylyltransferase
MVRTGGVLAIVPARGGSKSIPRKNVRPLCGIPLIAYSIEAGLSAASVDRVIVSTDDEAIAEVSRGYGAEVPFLRPASLAQDDTPDLPVFQHALQWMESHEAWVPEIVVQLRPTSPVRPPDCVDDAVAILRADLSLDSVRGVVVAAQNPHKMWRLDPDGMMAPLLDRGQGEDYNRPRQSLPISYWQTGHIDAIRTGTLVQQASMSGSRIKGLLMDPAYACDIDTDADWLRTEWMLRQCTRPYVKPPSTTPAWPAVVRMVVFDFDGVLTDNRVWVTGGGQEWVACNRSDGIGLATLRSLGIELLVLSTETHPVVAERCQKLQIACEHGVADKGARLRALLTERGIDPSDVIFVGNDTNDVACMRLVGCAVAVADAHPDALAAAQVVLTRNGGRAAVRELCDDLYTHLSSGSLR